MARGRSNEAEIDGLSPRNAHVLRALIREFVQGGEPVGSGTLSRNPEIDLSAASIRNVMAELEEQGFLVQPHTSAGRMPTDRAYRLFVDRLMRPARLGQLQTRQIDDALAPWRDEPKALLDQASKQLSQWTGQVGIVRAPRLSRLVVERIEFIRLDGRRVIAVLAARSGFVHHRMIQLEDAPDQQELDRTGRYLSDHFGGLALPEMQAQLRRRTREERAALDLELRRRLDLGCRALESEAGSDMETTAVFIDGTANLVGAPDFDDPEDLRSVFRTLEERERLIEMLDQLLQGQGVRIVIGHENPVADLARCSMVLASYGTAGRTVGTVGIVGPTRMEYPRAVALVGHLATAVSRLMSPDEDDY